jgi:hypothetical protein
VGVRVACFLFVGSVLPDILVFCVVQKTKMTSITDTHPSDPPQTKTKHTTQKTKIMGVCVAYHFSFLCCVFCFSLWGSVLLVILVFCVHRKLKFQATQTPHKQKTSKTDTHPPDLPQTKTKHTTFSVLCVLLFFVGIRVAFHFSFLCCVFCFCL